MVAPPPVDAYGETVAATEAESGGLPQFDTSVWGGQIVYLLFLFVVLYLLIAKVFAPRLRRVMDERATTISAAIATAKSVQAEAADQAEAAKAEVAEARARSRAMAAAARARVTEEANARRSVEEAEVNARIEAAEADIAVTRAAAMTTVGTIAADTVQAMVERLTGTPVSAADAAAAVKEAA